MQEVRGAFRIAWLTVSCAILLILLTPWMPWRDAVLSRIPPCERKPCALCGMTTSFLAITRGDLHEAERANRAGVPLYSLFLANEMMLAVWLFRGGYRNANA